MDGNKDEALRCVQIAEEAIASGNKERALKFLRIAQRLNHDLSVIDLLAACDKLDSRSSVSSVDDGINKSRSAKIDNGMRGERIYTEEHVKLIRDVNRNKDYYAILGVERTCSIEEIRKAYRKLSLKVHPDKNKAPGSEEAFKKVGKAFKCLSDIETRRQYDQTGLIEDYEHHQQYNVRRRRTHSSRNYYDDEFDPDEIFRSFFGQADMFRSHNNVNRKREMHGQHREESHGGGPNVLLLLQILPFLLIFALAYLPFSEPDYSLHKNSSHQILKTTERYGLEFFVKSSAFDENFPIGSDARASIEDSVIKDYRNMLWRYCHIEQHRRHWNNNLPTPNCNKLQSLGLA